MLYELSVENIALIQQLRLQFDAGVNALSGETGAGKSLIIDALSLLLGARGSDQMIRSGADKALVEGVFLAPFPAPFHDAFAEELAGEDTVVLTRELIRGGRSIARMNGRVVTLSLLRTAGRLLVNLHGQNEHILLLDAERQLALVDEYGGEDCLRGAEDVHRAYSALIEAERALAAFTEKKDQRAEHMARLQEKIDALEAAAPQVGELDALKAEASMLSHGETLMQSAVAAHGALTDSRGAVAALNEAAALFRQAASLDEAAKALSERLNDLYYEVEDAGRELETYRDQVRIDAYRQEEVETRIALLERLSRKYQCESDALPALLAVARAEYIELEDISLSGALFQQALEEKQTAYAEKAAALRQARARSCARLSAAIEEELHQLAMPKALFRVDLPATAPTQHGTEQAQFMICPNQGEGFQPVAKIASGGELSRIMLAIKVVIAGLDSVPTLVFDEIDSGMSGRALVSVAERMVLVGKQTQTLMISHAAVMAAAAARQIQIEKQEQAGRTVITAHPLTEEERVLSLARMIAGDHADATTEKQALTLLKQMR